MSDTFPRQYARTQRLTLGEPRSFTVSPDGARVLFVRSHGGSDSVNTLWLYDTVTCLEHEILDPRTVSFNLSDLTVEELSRRERAREGASGIVTYTCNADVTSAITVVGGHIIHIDLITNVVTVPDIAPGVFDARLSPSGNMFAYVRATAICIATLSGDERVIADGASAHESYGSAEFIAAEEMGRSRGFWWSPDSTRLALCRVDNSLVDTIFISDPTHPSHPATEHKYPAAGTANAVVSLHIVDVATTDRTDILFSTNYEYLNSATWQRFGLIVQTQTRDQKHVDIHSISMTDGSTAVIQTDDDEAWIDLVQGMPCYISDGRLLTSANRDNSRRLLLDNSPVTPSTLNVISMVSATSAILFIANQISTPWIHELWSYDCDSGSLTQVTTNNGIVSASGNAHCIVIRSSNLTQSRASFTVIKGDTTSTLESHAEESLVSPHVLITTVGAARIPVAILTPRDGLTTSLPVLFDPYGGPHAQRVLASNGAFNSSQWFADQGFVVVIADNAGTPGRGSASERAVYGDLASPVLASQVEVALALAEIEPRADMARVGIRGWSFGGYLAALAVMRRGDIFHAGIAGAPVTDWRLYDTHYTERYLGNPAIDDSNYVSTSLLEDVELLERPLLLIHGLADDNVVAAHTLQLSSALLAAGKPHEVLPLSGVTHMTPQEVVAENLLLHQLDFLQRHLT